LSSMCLISVYVCWNMHASFSLIGSSLGFGCWVFSELFCYLLDSSSFQVWFSFFLWWDNHLLFFFCCLILFVIRFSFHCFFAGMFLHFFPLSPSFMVWLFTRVVPWYFFPISFHYCFCVISSFLDIFFIYFSTFN
jgi:hypothetical protein